MIIASGIEVARESPGPGCRIVQFRTVVPWSPPCNEHLAVSQQGRRVITVSDVEVARGSPSPVRRVVEFRARGRIEAAVSSSRNEHLAVGQQGRRVIIACGIEVAGDSPGPGCGIVQFRARRKTGIKSACNKHFAVG